MDANWIHAGTILRLKKMNTIIAKKDITTNTWTVTKEVTASRDLRVSFSFVRGGETDFDFTDLKFGIKIYRATGEKELLLNRNWPVSDKAKHLKNVAPYLEEIDYVLDVNESYKVVISGGDGEHLSNNEFVFAVPKPASPYNSWVWDGVDWKAPVGPYSNNTTPPKEAVSGSKYDTFTWKEDLGVWVMDIDSPNPQDALNLPDRVIDPNNSVG